MLLWRSALISARANCNCCLMRSPMSLTIPRNQGRKPWLVGRWDLSCHWLAPQGSTQEEAQADADHHRPDGIPA